MAELAMTEAEVREAIRSSLEADGWLDPSWCPDDLASELLEEACERVHQVVGAFEVGTVLGRRVDRFYVRGRTQVGR